MSTWLCPEHGLYAGQELCPSCGKNGARVEEEAATMTTPSELKALLERAKVARLIGDAHRTQDYAGRTHGFIYNAGEVVPLAGVVIAAEGCDQEIGRARLDLFVAAVNALPFLLARIGELEEGLRPFANAARDLEAIGPDGIDDGLTVFAYIHARKEQEAQLSTSHFSRARTLLPPPPGDGM